MPSSPMHVAPSRLHFLVSLAVLALMVAAGCGGDDGKSTAKNSSIAKQAEQVAEKGVIRTKVPVYAGDPTADEAPKGDAVLSKLPPVTRPDPTEPAPAIRGSAGTTVSQWLQIVANDVATFWQSSFNARGKKFEPARITIFDVATDSACGGPIDPEEGPLYCRPDSTIYLPTPFFAEVARPIGDAAEAFAVAHEYGHRIQHLLGTLFLQSREGSFRTRNFELQADCLSGVWAAAVFQRGDIEPNDIAEIHELDREIGDIFPLPATNLGSHGTSPQRIAAFEQGYNHGRAGACRLLRFGRAYPPRP